MAGIVLRETLTGNVWNFGTLPGGILSFGSYKPGLYTLINSSGSSVNVVLFGQTHTVAAHSRWDFMANANIESIQPQFGVRLAGRFRVHDPVEA
jgi:hypothetical protein